MSDREAHRNMGSTRHKQETITTEALAQKVSEREAALNKFVPQVLELLGAHGTVVSHTVYNSHTSSQVSLDDFAGFDFHGSFGQSMHGGNTLKVGWANPRKGSATCRLHVYWQGGSFSVKECKVEIFEESIAWQNALEHALEEKDVILAGKMTAVAREVEAKEKVLRDARERRTLEDAAKRLGIR